MHTIEDTLARISHPQPVQLDSSGLIEASQQVLVEDLPQILVLHLKRFLYDRASDGIVKIRKPVQFAPELLIPLGTIVFFDFSELSVLIFLRDSVDLEIMAPNFGKSAESAHYKLCGVLYHHSESTGSGHFTVDVLHPNGDTSSEDSWMRIDDEVVSAVRHDEVYCGYDNEWVDDRCAYMLFYYRIARN